MTNATAADAVDAATPMTDARKPNDPDAAARMRASNLRVALTLASIAAVFFFGIIVAKFLGGYTIGMGVLGVAIFVFLVFVIVRAIRRER